jgi:hypothetical protein
MSVRRSMRRTLPKKASNSASNASPLLPYDAPRRLRNTLIDFSTLKLPHDVRLALAEAFWSHIGVRSEASTLGQWFHVRIFERFAHESGAIRRCPNAIITPDPVTLARLLQARDHLRAAAATIHPVRWQAFYAPQLRILEEDILTRFSAEEFAAAQPLRAQLTPLPDLR